jgi:hypothetical protein
MSELIPIRVMCHSGFKADEYPLCFFMDHQRLEITEIIDRWYQVDQTSDGPVSNYFKVITRDGLEYILKHELSVDEWYLKGLNQETSQQV